MPIIIKKCKFYIRKTNFIGFIIKLKQISIDLKKIEAIVNQQDLKNVIGLKLFLEFYNYYYYSFYLQSDAVPLQVYTDCACHYKENPPVPIQRQKPREYIGKMPCLRLTPGKGKPISYLLLEQPFVQGFTCLYFTNISIRCNAIKILVISALLYIHFLAPLYPLYTI